MIPKEMIERLRQLKEKVPLETRYTWKLPKKPIPIPGFQIPQDRSTPYAQNLFLKENLRPFLEGDTALELQCWIIRDWGRIRKFGKTAIAGNASNNKERIKAFEQELSAGALKRASFQVIPSLSKIASFWNPEQYAIYDRALFFL